VFPSLRNRIIQHRENFEKSPQNPYIEHCVVDDIKIASAFGRVIRIYKETEMSIFISKELRELKVGVYVNIAFLQSGFLSIDDKIKLEKTNKFININIKKPFCCYKCGERFDTGIQLLCHIRDRKYFSSFQIQDNNNNLNNIINNTSQPKTKPTQKKCKNCARLFDNKKALWHHINDSHLRHSRGGVHSKKKKGKLLPLDDQNIYNKPKWNCPWCSRGFKSEYDFKQHWNNYLHFKCDLCELFFYRKKITPLSTRESQTST